MEEITASWVRGRLPRRDPMGHKGTFGKVLCICGSVGFSGAAVFAGRAAVRTGSGLVYLGVPEPAWPVAAAKCDEVMPFPLPSREGRLSPEAEEPIRRRAGACDAVLVGCGLGRGPGCDALVRRLLDLDRPLVLDADGINALSGHMDALSLRRGRTTVLTPHEGEFLRAGGDLSRGREQAAADFAARHGAYLVHVPLCRLRSMVHDAEHLGGLAGVQRPAPLRVGAHLGVQPQLVGDGRAAAGVHHLGLHAGRLQLR